MSVLASINELVNTEFKNIDSSNFVEGSHFIEHKLLGGVTCIRFNATDKHTGIIYTIDKFSLANISNNILISIKFILLAKSFPNTNRLVGYYNNSQHLFLVYHEILGETILTQRKQLSLDDKLIISKKIIEALVHYHEHGLCVLTFSPNNIYYHKDSETITLSYMYNMLEVGMINSFIRQHIEDQYKLPEYYNYGMITAQPNSDVFLYGIILLYLFYDKIPISDWESYELIEIPSLINSYGDVLSKKLLSIILACLNKKPEKRLSSKTIFRYFNKYFDLYIIDKFCIYENAIARLLDVFTSLPDIKRDWKHSDFIINSKLGQGAYGSVYNVTDSHTNITYAMKEIRKLDKIFGLANELVHNVVISDCENVCSIIGYFFEDKYLYVIMNMCGTPLDRLPKLFTPKEQLVYFRQILNGLSCIHKNLILHLDLKPANILLNENTISIIDFGFSMYIPKAVVKYVGTPLYMAPEIISQTSIGTYSDMWSLGVILYIMLYSGEVPIKYTQALQSALKEKMLETKTIGIRHNISKIYLEYGEELGGHLKHLLDRLLDFDYKTRMTLDECIEYFDNNIRTHISRL
jgi:serine/threonine protein kinase